MVNAEFTFHYRSNQIPVLDSRTDGCFHAQKFWDFRIHAKEYNFKKLMNFKEIKGMSRCILGKLALSTIPAQSSSVTPSWPWLSFPRSMSPGSSGFLISRFSQNRVRKTGGLNCFTNTKTFLKKKRNYTSSKYSIFQKIFTSSLQNKESYLNNKLHSKYKPKNDFSSD